ncbi:PAAR domain-containing protein, partial [Pseudomonas vranovensis]|uniref:PAAR domain-containing protein n=1 Tax=Pseudomonas vranovensis TaxID=321661 RepID=UPI00048BFEA0
MSVHRMNINGRGAGQHGDQTTSGATCLSSQSHSTQSGVPHLRLGDATTPCPLCGVSGEIAEGETGWTIDGRPMAVDDVLIQCGCPPGSNRLVAPLVATRVASAPAPAKVAEQVGHIRTALPSGPASGFAPASRSMPVMTATPGTLEPGFYIVPRSMSGPQVLAQLGNPYLPARLQRLNPTFAQDFKAGELFILGDPDNGTACTREEAQLMDAAAQVRDALAGLSEEEANFMADYQGEIAGLLGSASLSMGVSTVMLGQGLRQVEGTLRALEELHQRSFSLHGHLNSRDFFAARRELYKTLDAQLKSAFLN